jgi:hypothetical protein
MNNMPVIDLSLRHPQLIIKDKGLARGVVLVLWFRLLRPACVGSMWAGITIYAYRYLLPFGQGDLSVAELLSYIAAIGAMASVLVMWMVLARVAHPFASKSRTQRILRRKAGLTVEPGPLARGVRHEGGVTPRVLVASHDANGLIAALRALHEPEHAEDDAPGGTSAAHALGQMPPLRHSLPRAPAEPLREVPTGSSSSRPAGHRRH